MNIKLKGKSDKFVIISPELAPIILEYDWYLSKSGYPTTYKSPDKKHHFGRSGLKMHQLIYQRVPKGYVVDHINRNRLDNRVENLRVCTIAENNYNRTKPKNGNNTYKGVQETANGWRASISKEGQTYTMNAPTEIQAAKLYDIMAEEIHGEYAAKNFT